VAGRAPKGRGGPGWEHPTLALVLLATSVTAVVCGLALFDGDLRRVVAATAAFSFPAVAAIVLRRHPRHAVGWLLLTLALVLPTGELAARLSTWDGGLVPMLAAWVFAWYWIVGVLVPLVWLPSVFPSGHLVGRRWRPVVAVPTIAGVVLALATTVQRRFRVGIGSVEDPWSIENPLGIAPWVSAEESAFGAVFFLSLFPAAVLAVVSLVVRFRRAGPTERRQLQWGALGVGGVAVAFVGQAVVDLLLEVRFPSWVGNTLFAAVPISFGVAILRGHLWDIDRFVSRSVTYVLATASLVAIYATSVVALQSLLRPLTGTSDLAVAASTLLVAASFGSLRRRIQRAVDGRFFRRRVDRQVAAERFALRLRDEVSLPVVVEELEAIATHTLGPSSAAVWLHPAASRPGAPGAGPVARP
jgi:hypothetical protein